MKLLKVQITYKMVNARRLNPTAFLSAQRWLESVNEFTTEHRLSSQDWIKHQLELPSTKWGVDILGVYHWKNKNEASQS